MTKPRTINIRISDEAHAALRKVRAHMRSGLRDRAAAIEAEHSIKVPTSLSLTAAVEKLMDGYLANHGLSAEQRSLPAASEAERSPLAERERKQPTEPPRKYAFKEAGSSAEATTYFVEDESGKQLATLKHDHVSEPEAVSADGVGERSLGGLVDIENAFKRWKGIE